MKKLIIIVMLCGVAGLHAQTRFQKIAGTTSNDRNYHLAAMPGGSLFATGYTESVAGNLTDAFLVKYNRFGEVQWSKTYGELGSENNWDVIVTQNHEVIGVGYSSDLAAYDAGIITRCDSNGTVIWSKGVVSASGNVNFYRVIETSTGHLVATGLTSRYGQDDILVCKFTSTGTLLWSRIVKSLQDDEIMGLIETSQGHYLLAGLTNDAGGSGSSEFAVVKTDASGNVIWKKRYGGSGGDRLNAIVEHGNAYYFLGWSSTGGIGNNDAVVMKTDTAGVPVWIKGYGTLQSERAFNMLLDSTQNSLIVAGYTDYSDSLTNNRNTFLMSLELTGQLNWAKSYGSTGTDGHWPTGLAMNDDEGYYVLGSTNTFGPGNYSLYLIKTDIAGNTACHQKDPQFSQQAMANWSGISFGTDSTVTLMAVNITIAGMPWGLTATSECCSLFADAGPDRDLCPGDTAWIGTPAIPGYMYSWSLAGNPVGTTAMLQVPSSSPGFYTLSVNAYMSACNASPAIVNVTQLPAPPKPTVSYVATPGNYLTSSSPTGNQWYYNLAAIPGADQQVYHAFLSGVYHVAVTNQEGCESVSDTIHHIAVGIEDPVRNVSVSLFPNPASGFIFITPDHTLEEARIICLDIAGKAVFSLAFSQLIAHDARALDVHHLPAGSYRLLISHKGGYENHPLVIIP